MQTSELWTPCYKGQKLMLVEVTIQVENSVISYLGTPVYLLASSPG